MRSLTSLFNAVGNLAASLNSLAGVVDLPAGRLRQQLAFDEAGQVLEHQPTGVLTNLLAVMLGLFRLLPPCFCPPSPFGWRCPGEMLLSP
jgi:hypothetical protein